MAKRYEVIACVGDPWDYTYEKVDEVTRWKEARRLEKLGAQIYLDGQRVFFVDHAAVQNAFDDLQFDEIVGLDMICDTSFEADARRKNAEDVLNLNKIELPEDYAAKIERRYANREPVILTFAWQHGYELKDGKYRPIFTAIETEELPF